jgi:hypothetical protein
LPRTAADQPARAFSGTKLALELVAADASRDQDTPIYRVTEGDEPPAFTAAFAPWTVKDQFADPYKRRLAELAAKRGDVAVASTSSLPLTSRRRLRLVSRSLSTSRSCCLRIVTRPRRSRTSMANG